MYYKHLYGEIRKSIILLYMVFDNIMYISQNCVFQFCGIFACVFSIIIEYFNFNHIWQKSIQGTKQLKLIDDMSYPLYVIYVSIYNKLEKEFPNFEARI